MRNPPTRSAATAVAAKVVSAERPNTLGLGQRELNAVLDFLDSTEDGPAGKRREFTRWPFRQVGVNVRLVHPGGSETSLRLAVRNLSRGGISLLHNGFIHTGTRCVVDLPRVTVGSQSSDGHVVRCQHRRGVLHEIGIKFKKPVNIRQFLTPRPDSELYSIETVASDALVGRMLFVEDGELDTRVFQHYLRETCLKVDIARTPDEAIAKLGDRHELYLIDWNMPGLQGGSLIARIRAERISSPIIVITDNPVALMDEGILETQSVGLLKKPYQQDELLRAIAERLLIPDTLEIRDAKGALPLAPKQLVDIASQLERTLAASDLSGAKVMAQQLGGTAASFGLRQVAVVAAWATDAVAKAESIDAAAAAVKQLAAACRQDARDLEHRAA